MKKIAIAFLTVLLCACSQTKVDMHVNDAYLEVQETTANIHTMNGYAYEFVVFAKKDLTHFGQTDVQKDPYILITKLDKKQMLNQKGYKMKPYLKDSTYKAFLVKAISKDEVDKDDFGKTFFSDIDKDIQKDMHAYLVGNVQHLQTN